MYDFFFLVYDTVPYIHFHRTHPPVLHSASSALGSVNEFFIQLIALGGQTTATTFPFTNPNGTGPNILPSLLQSRLSPANQQCPSGTWNISSFTSPPITLRSSKSVSLFPGVMTHTKSPGMPITRFAPLALGIMGCAKLIISPTFMFRPRRCNLEIAMMGYVPMYWEGIVGVIDTPAVVLRTPM